MTALARSRGSVRKTERRHLGLVRDEGIQPMQAVAGTFAGVGLVFIVAALFGLAIAHTMLAQGESRLVEIQERLAVATEHSRELGAEVAALESPARIEEEAEGRLGMVRPARVQWLTEVDPHTDLEVAELGGLVVESRMPSS